MQLTEHPSAAMLNRAAKEWGRIANEPVIVEELGGYLYAFGSEIGMMRLAHKFRSFNVRYSQNRGSWYFCNERRPGEER